MLDSSCRQGMLSAFPLLAEEEFASACHAFLDRVRAPETQHGLSWSSVRLVKQTGGSVLKISKTINCSPAPHGEDALRETSDSQEPQIDPVEEDDPEALTRTTDSNPYFQVEYDILLSPTYQVPVLYFVLRGSHVGPVGIETVYQYLVPDQYKKELKSVGVMGGISLGSHPEYGTPAFFVHPCNTAEAMRHVVDRQDVHAKTYLLIWLGLVGNCVGLHIPCELVANEKECKQF